MSRPAILRKMFSARTFLAALCLFVFVLPIPETTALRHLLLVGLLSWLGLNRFAAPAGRMNVAMQQPLLPTWLLLLSLWLLAQAMLFSPVCAKSFEEIYRQWLPALLCALLGYRAVPYLLARGLAARQILTAIIAALLAQTVFSLIAATPHVFATSHFPEGKTLLTAGKLEISFWNNLLLTLISVDFFARKLYRLPITNLPRGVLTIAFAVAVASNLAFGARNGIIGSVLLIFSLIALIVFRERQHLGGRQAMAAGLACIALGVGLVWANLRLDHRWEAFEETAGIAWQIDKHAAWWNPDAPLPALQSGESVELSAYLRISWLRGGLELALDNPLGIGYQRNAFAEALRQKYGTGHGHSHSGLIDWTIGTGFPGLILWLGMIAWILYIGLQRYLVQNDPIGLALFLVTSGFTGRMVLDSINRDHMLMMLFLILGLLLSLPPTRPSSPCETRL